MATDIGANIVQNDLIFGFDSGYGVADNSTATRFYPGEPTVNYVSDSPSQGGWSGGIDVLDSSQKKFKCHISNFSANPGAGWRSFTWNMNDHSGSDVTISLDFETVGPNGTMSWIMVGQTNTHTSNNSGAGQYMGYSATSEKTIKSTTSKERVTWTGTVGSTGTASQPSGHIGFTIWISLGVPGNQDAYVIVSNVQIEKKDHATPFVNGTRSNTAGLIDLKRTTDIDVSNVSFDSTGQPTFDGTDDRIGLGDNFDLNDHFSDGGDFSIEVITKMKESASQNGGVLCNQKYQSEADPAGFGLVIRSSNQYALNLTNNTPISYENLASIPFNQDEYHHIVYTFESSTGKVVSYSNGTQYTSITNSSYSWNIPTDSTRTYIGYNTQGGWGNYINMDIPIAKVYGRALSADEVQQNYNAYKKRFDL